MYNLSAVIRGIAVAVSLALATIGGSVVALGQVVVVPPEYLPRMTRLSSGSAQAPDCPPLTPYMVGQSSWIGSQCWLVRPTSVTTSTPWILPAPDGVMDPWRPTQVIGFPLNLDLHIGVLTPEFGPRLLDPRESSFALLPSEPGELPSPVGRMVRPVLDGMVDLVTGMPLIQETDFELGFGTGVFRHTRTYSRVHAQNRSRRVVHSNTVANNSSGHFWDWQGYGWMMGEAPLLLIDSAHYDYVEAGKRCTYLIVDSHHAIPFERREDDGRYEAPHRFNAKIAHDGVWVNEDWSSYPTTFWIWLDGGSLKYTFKVAASRYGENGPEFYDDQFWTYGQSANPVPSGRAPIINSEHFEEVANGFGVPGYALLVSIEDRAGNRVAIEYEEADADIGRTRMVNGPTYSNSGDCEPCRQCIQLCAAKGQISRLRLFPAGAQSAAWTLIYTYRGFVNWYAETTENSTIRGDRHYHEALNQHALHSIHVFEGEVAKPSTSATIPGWRFVFRTEPGIVPPDQENDYIGSLDEVESLVNACSLRAIDPDSWKYEVRYLYTEVAIAGPFPFVWGAELQPFQKPWWERACRYPEDAPQLLKATVRVRNEDGPSESITTRHTLYGYSSFPLASGAGYHSPQLSWILRPGMVDRITEACREEDPNWSINAVFDPVAPLKVRDDDGSIRVDSVESLADVLFDSPGVLCITRDSAFAEELRGHIRWPGDKLGLHSRDGEQVVSIVGDHGASHYRIFNFVLYPPGSGGPTPEFSGGDFVGLTNPWASSFLFHEPFRWGDSGGVLAPELAGSDEIAGRSRPVWITVVDQYATREDALGGCRLGAIAESNAGWEGRRPFSRRVVQCAFNGALLKDRLFQFSQDGSGSVVASSGISEEYVVDRHSRIVERKSIGYGSIPDEDSRRDTHGFIEIYRYPEDVENRPAGLDPIERLIKRGDEGEPMLVYRKVHRDDRRDLALLEVFFPEGESGLSYTTEHDYALEPFAREDGSSDWRIIEHTVAGPLFPIDESGVMYRSVSRTRVNRTASYESENWSGRGMYRFDSQDPQRWKGPPGEGDQFFVDYEYADQYGRPTCRIVDMGCASGDFTYLVTDPDAPRSGVELGTFPIPGGPGVPDNFRRVDLFESPPLNEATQWLYCRLGVEQIWRSSGVHDYFGWTVEAGELYPGGPEVEVIVRRSYPGVVRRGTEYFGLSPGRIETFTSDLQPVDIHDVVWTDSPRAHPRPTQTQLASLGRAIIEHGRATRSRVTVVKVENFRGGVPTGETMVSSSSTDAFGMTGRTRAPDGTVTRNVRDNLGRVFKVFRGTKDVHVYWGNTSPDPETWDDNLVLLEKRYFGLGKAVTDDPSYDPDDDPTHNALVHVASRKYRQRPAGQYQEQGESSNEDAIGWLERLGHDWRMRQVRVARFDQDGVTGCGPLLSVTCTYFDNLGRERIVAEYGTQGHEAGWPHDPRCWNPYTDSSPIPSVADLLDVSAAKRPFRLTETCYDSAGKVEEVRSYNVENGEFLATRTFTDWGGRALFNRSPNGGSQRYTYDAKGRQRTLSLFAGDTEMTRTTNFYDEADDLVETGTLERVAGASGELGESNAVRTRAFYWYDAKRRLIATAELGTENSGNAFIASPPVLERANLSCPVVYPANSPMIPETLEFSGDVTSSSGPLSRAIITGQAYDESGRRHLSIAPNGVNTRYFYDGHGNLVETIENWQDESAANRRITRYRYALGRLVAMASVRADEAASFDWDLIDEHHQVTHFRYGAEVVRSQPGEAGDFEVISRCNEWISAVGPPLVQDPQAQPPEPEPFSNAEFTFAYYPDGLLAIRRDRAGNELRYTYDGAGRLVVMDVHAAANEDLFGAGPSPDLIRLITYTYDEAGRLATITAHRKAGGTTYEVVAQNQYTYDARGNLLRDYQQHGGEVVSGTPFTGYGWAYASGRIGGPDDPPGDDPPLNFDRLAAMYYPNHTLTGSGVVVGRTLDFHYGQNLTDPDSYLCRVTRIEDGGGTSSSVGDFSTYGYSGASRRVYLGMADGKLRHDLSRGLTGSEVGYPGLDRFGRLQDLHYESHAGSAWSTQQRFQFLYDAAGNRSAAYIEQRPVGSNSRDNTRSAVYSYDLLSRLTRVHSGVMSGFGTGEPSIDSTSPEAGFPLVSQWDLDIRGNWGPFGSALPGLTRTGDLDLDDTVITLGVRHDTGYENEITSVTTSVNSGTPTTTTFVSDRAGNLVCDGVYVFQYDSLNRLVRISLKGSATFDEAGRIDDGELGPWVVHYTYDGLGRLICRQMPFPAPGSGNNGQNPAELVVERYFYDGIRRIQELWTDPVVIVAGGEPELDPQSMSGLEGASNPGSTPQPGEPAQTETWLEREYVYGPGSLGGGGHGGGIDEFVCQLDRNGVPWYVLQDASTDVAAITDAAGVTVLQYAWDPYGECLKTEAVGSASPAPPINKIGHHGLFHDRLDIGIADAQGNTQPQIGRFAFTTCWVRNRTYLPSYGRWAQRDPLVTGQPLLAVASSGELVLLGITHFNGLQAFRDGPSRYGYVRSDPAGALDPTGLFLVGSFGERLAVAKIQTDMLGLQTAIWAGRTFGLRAFVLTLATGSAGSWELMASIATSPGGLAVLQRVESELRDLVSTAEDTEPLPPDARVVRGGTCKPEQWEHGRGVVMVSGRITRASVNSAPGVPLERLCRGLPHARVGVSTVAAVRAAGGNVVRDPTGFDAEAGQYRNPYHALLSGLTPQQASALFQVQPNPARGPS